MSAVILRPTATATVDVLSVDVTDGDVSLDSGRVPYGESTITTALVDVSDTEDIDPREDQRVSITAGDDEVGSSRSFNLGLNRRVVNHENRTVTLYCATDEAILQRFAVLTADAGARGYESSLRGVVNYVLAKIGASLEAGSDDANVTAYWPLTNYVTNPRVQNTTGYVLGANAKNLALDTGSGGLLGANYVIWQSVAAGPANLLTPSVSAAVPGQWYTGVAALRSDVAGRQIILVMHFYDQAGNLIDEELSPPVAAPVAPTWGYAVVTAQAPPGAVEKRLVLSLTATGANQYGGVGGLMLVDGKEAVPIFTGATTGGGYTYTWQATANASASTRTPTVERLPELFTWQPGVNAWDFLQPLTTQAGLRLYCDENRDWYLIDPATWAVDGALSLAGWNSIRGTDDITIGDPEVYCTGVVVWFEWEDPNTGQQMRQYDSAGVEGIVRTITLERPWPGPGMAAAILSRVTGRGRNQDVTALSDWTASPGMSATITLPGTNPQIGQLAYVQWDLAAGVMDVRAAALIDVTPGDWIAVDPDLDWTDVDPNTNWTGF